MFWFIGLSTILLGRTFYAGLRYKDLFYREPGYRETSPQLDDDKVAGYLVRTVIVAVTWPITLPLIGIFVLGQKFNKKDV